METSSPYLHDWLRVYKYTLTLCVQVQSGSEVNISTGGSFRHFDKTDVDYGLGEAGIPPQPLRPAPFPPSTFQSSHTSRNSVGSTLFAVDNNPPPPKIPPPPPVKGFGAGRAGFPLFSSASHVSQDSPQLHISSNQPNQPIGGGRISMGELIFSTPSSGEVGTQPGATEREIDLLGPLEPETEKSLVETMREEIRLDHKRMCNATKDLLGDYEDEDKVQEELWTRSGDPQKKSAYTPSDETQVLGDKGGERKFSAPEIGLLDAAGSVGPVIVVPTYRNRSFSLRQASVESIGDSFDLSSPESLPFLQRAMSCDSVCSDTSVVLGDFDAPHITGYLCIGLEYDM